MCAAQTNSMPFTHVLAVDLNWGAANRRVAVALCQPGDVIDLQAGDRSDATIHDALSQLPNGARVLVLLDVPIEGVRTLGDAPTRQVDRVMASAGFAILPASGAGMRGVLLRDGIQAAAAEQALVVDVREMYPFAIYKVLAYLEHRGQLDTLVSAELRDALDTGLRTHRHPRYKRWERDATRRWEAIRYVHELLVSSALHLAWRGLPAPNRVRGQAEDHLVDLYDAALGGVLGALVLRGSPYAVIVGDAAHGEIALLADAWLQSRLAARLPVRPLDSMAFG